MEGRPLHRAASLSSNRPCRTAPIGPQGVDRQNTPAAPAAPSPRPEVGVVGGPVRDELVVVDDARVVVPPRVAQRHRRAVLEPGREVEGVVLRAAAVLDVAEHRERLAGHRAEDLEARADRDVREAGLALVAVDGAEVHEPLALAVLDLEGDRGVAVELHVRQPDEVVALGAERLGHDDHHVVVAHRDAGRLAVTVASGDVEVLFVDVIALAHALRRSTSGARESNTISRWGRGRASTSRAAPRPRAAQAGATSRPASRGTRRSSRCPSRSR